MQRGGFSIDFGKTSLQVASSSVNARVGFVIRHILPLMGKLMQGWSTIVSGAIILSCYLLFFAIVVSPVAFVLAIVHLCDMSFLLFTLEAGLWESSICRRFNANVTRRTPSVIGVISSLHACLRSKWPL